HLFRPWIPSSAGTWPITSLTATTRAPVGAGTVGGSNSTSLSPTPRSTIHSVPGPQGLSHDRSTLARECRDPPSRRALRYSNQKSKDSGCLSLWPLPALIRLFSAIHCGREGHLVRLSLAIERASCLVVPSRAKTVRSNEDPLSLLTALKWNS